MMPCLRWKVTVLMRLRHAALDCSWKKTRQPRKPEVVGNKLCETRLQEMLGLMRAQLATKRMLLSRAAVAGAGDQIHDYVHSRPAILEHYKHYRT